MINKCWKNLLPAKFFQYKNEDKETDLASEFGITDNDLLNDIHKLDNYQDTTEDVVWNWIMKNDNNFAPIPSNAEIIQMITEDDKTESETDEENLTPQEIIFALNKVISFNEKNDLLTADEFAVLRKYKNIAIKLKIQ